MIKLTIIKTTTEDNYEQGEIGKSSEHFLNLVEFKTMQNAYDSIVACYGMPFLFDDRLETQTQENADGYAPTEHELARFKANEINLYACSYSFYFSEITERTIDHDELKATFKGIEVLS